MYRVSVRGLRRLSSLSLPWSSPSFFPRSFATSSSNTKIHRAFRMHQIISLPPVPELLNPNFLDVIPLNSSNNTNKEPEETIPTQFSQSTTTSTQSVTPDDPLINAFYSLSHPITSIQNILSERVHDLLNKAWEKDPQATLKIIWHIRSIQHGKSDRFTFYKAFGWLFKHHPLTALSSLPHLVSRVHNTPTTTSEQTSKSHGTYQDLCNVLNFLITDQLESTNTKVFKIKPLLAQQQSEQKNEQQSEHHEVEENEVNEEDEDEDEETKQHEVREETKQPIQPIRKKRNKPSPEELAQFYSRLQKKLKDPKFRALYIAVAQIFANDIAKDFDRFQKQPHSDLNEFSLAPCAHIKQGMFIDRLSNIGTAVGILLYFKRLSPFSHLNLDKFLNPKGLIGQEYTQITNTLFCGAIMAPLRKKLGPLRQDRKLQYKFIWEKKKTSSIPELIVSQALYNTSHQAKTSKNLQAYADNPTKARIFDYVSSILKENSDLVQSEWDDLVKSVKESGYFRNSIAICNTSKSMTEGNYLGSLNYLHIALSYSLLLSQVARTPFANHFITFSSKPSLISLSPQHSLSEKLESMVKSESSEGIDFESVLLDLILPLAREHNVKKEDMVKRIFVFSNVQFDDKMKPSSSDWKSDYSKVEETYKKAGYDVPQIIYCNLADPFKPSFVESKSSGVTLISGWGPSSPQILEGFDELENAENNSNNNTTILKTIDPAQTMKEAINQESFNVLEVRD